MAKPLVLISSRSFSTGNVDLIKILNDSGCEIRKISSDHKIEEISSDLINAVAWIAGMLDRPGDRQCFAAPSRADEVHIELRGHAPLVVAAHRPDGSAHGGVEQRRDDSAVQDAVRPQMLLGDGQPPRRAAFLGGDRLGSQAFQKWAERPGVHRL